YRSRLSIKRVVELGAQGNGMLLELIFRFSETDGRSLCGSYARTRDPRMEVGTEARIFRDGDLLVSCQFRDVSAVNFIGGTSPTGTDSARGPRINAASNRSEGG